MPAAGTSTNPGLFLWYDPKGQTVTAGSADELYIENTSSNSVTYDIIIAGRSA